MSKKVEIVCILDRSGSMSSIMDEAIGALNLFIDDQKKLPGKASFTLVAFDDRYEKVMDRIKLKDVRKISRSDVEPRGMTALNDAVGRTIASIDSKKVVLLIQTDGHENASSEYTTDQVKKMILEKEKAGWDISFIGAGIDAFQQGAQYGLKIDKCLTVSKSAAGMTDFGTYSNNVTRSYRS